MAINLLSLQPNKVSRDLSGYITYIYGAAKTGKTTFASKTLKPLLLAFEVGYKAIPGIVAQDIGSWSDVRMVMKELKKPEVKEAFSTIIFDTLDIAGAFCEQYICLQNDVETLNKIPYGQGWTLVKKEFETVVRTITQLGYAVIFISHDKDKTFTRKDGTTYNQIVPSAANSYNEIAKNIADIYAYAEKYINASGASDVRLVLRSYDNSIDCGTRFKFMKPVIPFSYEDLVNAVNNAIDEEATATGNKFVTEERNVSTITAAFDYEALIEEFQEIVGSLMQKDSQKYGPRITQVVNKYLGAGHKVSETTPAQAQLISLIISDIRDFE